MHIYIHIYIYRCVYIYTHMCICTYVLDVKLSSNANGASSFATQESKVPDTDDCDLACPGFSSATASRFKRPSKLTEKTGNLSREVLALNRCGVWGFGARARTIQARHVGTRVWGLGPYRVLDLGFNSHTRSAGTASR